MALDYRSVVPLVAQWGMVLMEWARAAGESRAQRRARQALRRLGKRGQR